MTSDLSRSDATTATILIVDDDSSILGLISAVLTNAGYQVVEASSAREALAALVDPPNPVGLVITDFQMEVMDGAELATEIRRLYSGISVIILSGMDVPMERDAMLEVLGKPIEMKALIKRIQQLLGGSKGSATGCA